MALVHQVFCVWLVHNKDIKLYDGPGPLSRAVNITQENIGVVCFSRFMGYAEILSESFVSGDIDYWIKHSESYSLGLCEKSIADDNSSLHFTARDTGSGVHCSWTIDHEFDEMQIHHISFQGFDMFSFHTDMFSIISVGICQYGGLHVLFEEEATGDIFDPFPLCNSIYNRPKLLLPIRRKIKRAYVIFTTFDQYSTGHMEVALMRFPECELYTVNFLDCVNDGFDTSTEYIYSDGKMIFAKKYPSYSESIPHCKNVWILNNLGNRANMDGRCFFTFTYIDLVTMFMIGTHKSVIHNWIIPQTQYMEGSVEEDYYNFMMVATVSSNFPSNMITIQQRTIVQRDAVVVAFLHHVIALEFYSNISFTDLHATVVQIQFFQNRACASPMERLQVIPSGIKQLYFASNALRRSALHPFHETLGKNNCSFMLKGKVCERDNVTYADVMIDHWRSIVLEHETIKEPRYNTVYRASDIKLNISIHNETQQCSEACQLDITIEENLMLTPKIVRMLKWENIKAFSWRVQLTYAGFRLHIDQKCSSPCDQMCDVAVEITVYHEEFNCLMPHKDFAGEISSEVMGSWNDANAYCEQKGMQMLSLHTDDDVAYEETPVDDIRKLVCSQIKLHEELYIDELTVFVGLDKSSQVGLWGW